MSIAEELSDLMGGMGAAGSAAEELGEVIEGVSRGVREFGAVCGTTADGVRVGSTSMREFTNEALKANAAAAKAGTALRDSKGRFISAGSAAGEAADGAKSATSALDGLAESGIGTNGVIATLTGALKSLGPEGQAAAAIITVLVAVVTGLAAALWSLTEAAVAISQEKDALAETFGAITDGAKSGLDVVNDLSDVAAKLPFDEGKVLGWGKAMAAAGKSGDALAQSVNAIAASGAIMKDNGAAALAFSKRLQTAADTGEKIKLDMRMQRMLQETGVRATELAKALGIAEDKLSSTAIDAGKLGDAFEKALIAKGAGALEKMSLTWGSISGKLKDGWEDLFEDLGTYVQPLMKEVRDFFAEFSAGTTLQAGAKSAVTSFFSTVLGWATKAMHAVHVGFLMAQIGALKLYIALAPFIQAMRAIYSNEKVLLGLKIILGLLVTPIALVVAFFVALGAVLVTLGAAIGYIASALAAGIAWVVGAVGSLISKIVGGVSGLATGGMDAAHNFVNGIVNGIKGGVGAVADAVKGLASGAVSAFTSALGIKSPSRVMKAHGRQLPAGAAEGIDDGADEAQRSMEDMLEPPKAKPRARSATAQTSRGNITVNFYGSAKDFPSFREQAMKFFQEELGAGPDGATA